MTPFFQAMIESFWKILIILDPFLGLAMFLALTKGMDAKERAKQALVATSVALGLLLLFLFIGDVILSAIGIKTFHLRIAGGILLLILGIQAVLGVSFGKKSQKTNKSAAAVIIGTPMLCGPGAITTTIVLASNYGKFPVFLAIMAAIIITWIILYFANSIAKLIREKGIEIISRVMGLILAAVAIQMIIAGIIDVIKLGLV